MFTYPFTTDKSFEKITIYRSFDFDWFICVGSYLEDCRSDKV